jgi:hypothetical protein
MVQNWKWNFSMKNIFWDENFLGKKIVFNFWGFEENPI